jgi:hypothetical protein
MQEQQAHYQNERHTNAKCSNARNWYVMAQTVRCWTLITEAQVCASVSPCGMWWMKWYWDRFFSKFFWFYLVIPPGLSILIYHLWMNNRPAGGHSSETWSHPLTWTTTPETEATTHCPPRRTQGNIDNGEDQNDTDNITKTRNLPHWSPC